MDAALMAIGTEMLQGGRRDTNSDWLCEELLKAGVRPRLRCTVPDDEAVIESLVRTICPSFDLTILTGGLGPTMDDRTRQAVAVGLGRPLDTDPEMEETIKRWFASRGRHWRTEQAVQAMKPRGGVWLENRIGTAPGFLVGGEFYLAALPGVPAEMRQMFAGRLLPKLRLEDVKPAARRTFHIGGRTESWVDGLLGDIYQLPGLTVTVLAGAGTIEIQLVSENDATGSAQDILERADREIRGLFGANLYGIDGDTLPEVVGRELSRRGQTLATAESCTAGMIASAVTDVPGSSGWFKGGLVVYDDNLKILLAGVSPGTLEMHGAVSRPVAIELAAGARERCRSDVGLAVTGIAGPSGGMPHKPVGLVHFAISDGDGTYHWSVRFSGDRRLIRERTVAYALDRLRRRLLEKE